MTKKLPENPRLIDLLAFDYGSLDLASIQILLTIDERPGYSISEIAKHLKLNEKFVQEKVTALSTGRKRRLYKKQQIRNLITVTNNSLDRRKRVLKLSTTGKKLINNFINLSIEVAK